MQIKGIRPLLSLKWHMIEVGIHNIKRVGPQWLFCIGGGWAGRWGVGSGQNQWQSKEKGKEEPKEKDKTLSKTEVI